MRICLLVSRLRIFEYFTVARDGKFLPRVTTNYLRDVIDFLFAIVLDDVGLVTCVVQFD